MQADALGAPRCVITAPGAARPAVAQLRQGAHCEHEGTSGNLADMVRRAETHRGGSTTVGVAETSSAVAFLSARRRPVARGNLPLFLHVEE
jgi:hypothetical protein